MKITRQDLVQLIKEELDALFKEQTPDEKLKAGRRQADTSARTALDSMGSRLDALMGEPKEKPKPKPVVKAKPEELPWDHPSKLIHSTARKETPSGTETVVIRRRPSGGLEKVRTSTKR